MSIESGTIAAKIVGINQTKAGLSSVLQNWGEEVPQTFGAYPDAFDGIFTNLDDKIDSVRDSLSDYLPLSGGTVDKLSVDSADFYVKNLLSVETVDGKMGSLMIGSDIDSTAYATRYAPIAIGNNIISYGPRGYDSGGTPNIVIGNDNMAESYGIVIGGGCGKSYSYDLGSAPDAQHTVNSIVLNPTRHAYDVNELVFVDSEGNPATPDIGDRISLIDESGIMTTISRNGANTKWGRLVTRRIGGRIIQVWVDGGPMGQQQFIIYQRVGQGSLIMKFEPDDINSIDHSAAAEFSIAIGNDTMAGVYLSSDGNSYQTFCAGAVAIGHGNIAKDVGTVAIGTNSLIQGRGSVGIGFNANTLCAESVQIGTGTNNVPYSMQVGEVNFLSSSSTSAWVDPKFNPNLLPDNIVITEDLTAYATTDSLTAYATNDSLSAYATNDSLSSYATKNDLNEYATQEDLENYATVESLADYAQKSELATVATTGSYNDLEDTPTIPTVGNGTLTIKTNGTTLTSFNANASTNATADIEIPTNTSDLENDSGYITQNALNDYALIGTRSDLSTVNSIYGTKRFAIVKDEELSGALQAQIDGKVNPSDLNAYLPLSGGTISSDTFKWVMSNGYSNMLSVDPVGGNYALGNASEAGPYLALAIGTNAHATGGAVAIGGLNAWAIADGAIQIGQGTNGTANTTQIKDWQLLDANGNIPEARLSSVGFAKVGTASDLSSANTIYGSKKYTDDRIGNIDSILDFINGETI